MACVSVTAKVTPPLRFLNITAAVSLSPGCPASLGEVSAHRVVAYKPPLLVQLYLCRRRNQGDFAANLVRKKEAANLAAAA